MRGSGPAITGPIAVGHAPGPKRGIPARAVAEKRGTVGFTGPLSMVDLDVAAAAGGDRGAFAAIYDRYSPRLFDFCVGMLRDPDAAADAVQDTFCTAATRLHQLREPDKLRPWLYAIARREALQRIRARTREHATDDLPDHPSLDDGPDVLAARSELARLVADAAGGLSDRDHTVLEPHYRHGLDGPELADALGVSHTAANTMVGRLRTTVERSLGALLVARDARAHPGRCVELDSVIADWDGQFSVLMRKRIARHLDGCPACDAVRQQLVNPRALLASTPMIMPAPWWLREHVLTHATPHLHAAASTASSTGPTSTSWWPGTKATAAAHGVKSTVGGVSAAHLALVAPLVAAAVLIPVVVSTTETAEPTTIAASAPNASLPTTESRPQFEYDTPTGHPTSRTTAPPRGSSIQPAPGIPPAAPQPRPSAPTGPGTPMQPGPVAPAPPSPGGGAPFPGFPDHPKNSPIAPPPPPPERHRPPPPASTTTTTPPR